MAAVTPAKIELQDTPRTRVDDTASAPRLLSNTSLPATEALLSIDSRLSSIVFLLAARNRTTTARACVRSIDAFKANLGTPLTTENWQKYHTRHAVEALNVGLKLRSKCLGQGRHERCRCTGHYIDAACETSNTQPRRTFRTAEPPLDSRASSSRIVSCNGQRFESRLPGEYSPTHSQSLEPSSCTNPVQVPVPLLLLYFPVPLKIFQWSVTGFLLGVDSVPS